MFAVKIIKSGRYIQYCDNCWYETFGAEPLYTFTLERAHEIVNQMKNHYVYQMSIEGEDGSVENINFLSKGNPMTQTAEQPVAKKSLRKITVRR